MGMFLTSVAAKTAVGNTVAGIGNHTSKVSQPAILKSLNGVLFETETTVKPPPVEYKSSAEKIVDEVLKEKRMSDSVDPFTF